MERREETGLGEVVKTVLYAFIIAIFVRTIAFEPFRIPSGSMIPSLLIGDYLFVSKYSYGYSKHSLPYSIPLIKEGRILASTPKRGDVVVFKLPKDNKTDYIKRVIGMPGDKVQVNAGRLYINDKLIEREKIGDYVSRDARGNAIRFTEYTETLPEGRKHKIIEASDEEMFDYTPVFRVPENHYFMMGDNRDNSDDSRAGVGYVPFENLEGRAEVLFFSNDGSADFWQIWRWPMAVRWGRLFNKIK